MNGHLAIVNVALPTIGRKLHTPESSLQWVVTGYALTFGGFLLLGGRAGDLLGRRRILMAGLFVFIAASLGLSLLVYTTSTAPQVGWGAARTVTLLAVWAALLAALVVIETRVEAPLMPLRIFQNKTLAPPLLGQPGRAVLHRRRRRRICLHPGLDRRPGWGRRVRRRRGLRAHQHLRAAWRGDRYRHSVHDRPPCRHPAPPGRRTLRGTH